MPNSSDAPILAASGDKRRSSQLFPSIFQFDYLHLIDLRRAIARRAGGVVGRVLDYGCGDEPYRQIFCRCTSYEGADFKHNRQAKWTLDEEGRIPTQLDANFDAVLSLQVLEHVSDIAFYLAECRRALKPGGQIVLTTHGIWEHHPVPRDYHRWTMDGLTEALETNGFETIRIEALTTRFRSLLQQLQLLVRTIRIPGRRLLTAFLNVIAIACTTSRPMTDDKNSLAICYLFVGRRRP